MYKLLAELAITNPIPYTNTASLVVSPTIAVTQSLIGHEPNCEVTAFFNAIHKTFCDSCNLLGITVMD